MFSNTVIKREVLFLNIKIGIKFVIKQHWGKSQNCSKFLKNQTCFVEKTGFEPPPRYCLIVIHIVITFDKFSESPRVLLQFRKFGKIKISIAKSSF